MNYTAMAAGTLILASGLCLNGCSRNHSTRHEGAKVGAGRDLKNLQSSSGDLWHKYCRDWKDLMDRIGSGLQTQKEKVTR